MPQDSNALKIGDKFKLQDPKQLFISEGVNRHKYGIVSPKYLLVVCGQRKDYTWLKVAKMQLKKDFIKHGDIVRISNDSLINLQFKRL